MIRTKQFQIDGSQAVRLPKNVAVPETVREMVILRDEARRVIVPADAVWDDLTRRGRSSGR